MNRKIVPILVLVVSLSIALFVIFFGRSSAQIELTVEDGSIVKITKEDGSVIGEYDGDSTVGVDVGSYQVNVSSDDSNRTDYTDQLLVASEDSAVAYTAVLPSFNQEYINSIYAAGSTEISAIQNSIGVNPQTSSQLNVITGETFHIVGAFFNQRTLETKRYVISQAEGEWTLVTGPEYILTVYNSPGVDTELLDSANSLNVF